VSGAISVFDLFSIGIGPSSSHTVGPMRAAKLFARSLAEAGVLAHTRRVAVELFGSLGATGSGHGSERAIILGLMGEDPETVDTATAEWRALAVRQAQQITILGSHPIAFAADDLVLHRRRSLPGHPNAMTFSAELTDGATISRTFYSVGGGFVVDADAAENPIPPQTSVVPYPFTTAGELLEHCETSGLSVSQVMLANESVRRSPEEVRNGLMHIWRVMQQCVDEGCRAQGILPGGLLVRRRAPGLFAHLRDHPDASDPLQVADWVNLFALAVNEQNAAGGRIVTAPTNGAAGIIPAVLHYYRRFVPGADDDGVVRFLLSAAAVGVLYKENASISGAEVGCQGEVGSACSMAAGALCEALGGTPAQVENAAEIGMEHNLGLTCDPVGGLVQIPCIERNAVAAVKAINAARLALRGDGSHLVSLDQVIATMRQTGADMNDKYKETSRGGLAVNVVEC